MKKLNIKKISIFGPQGSGKGTQAELLSKSFGFVYISTGNIFRQEIQNKTKLGKLAGELINIGQLVPDKITNEIVKRNLEKKQAQELGFILDGYPRTLGQMEALEKFARLTDALVVDISDKEAIFRIGGRLSCVCGRTYHIKFNPPKNDSLCDNCGKKLIVRDDDKPEAIQKRLRTYHEQTEPIFKNYEKQGILRRINGEQPIPRVYEDVAKALGL